MVKDFKAFLLRGNVVDLAVAVIIGAAFQAVVSSLVKDLLTPLFAIPGSADFSALRFTINKSSFFYGEFLNSLISFISVAAVVFFFVVRPINALSARRASGSETPPSEKTCPFCISSIPRAATVCAFCTREQKNA